jgi:3-isopropylmalate/(R)-2-methylmalate dehydratase large subunit
MAQTAVEKILAAHAGRPVRAGDLAIVDVDLVMATDGNAPLAIRLLRNELAGVGAVDGSKIVLVIDHCAPAPNEGAANLQRSMRTFAEETGALLYDAGEGISHVLLPEQGHARPGLLIVGSDSHTVTYGAVNCLGTGMGSTDVAVAMATGRVWVRVPETIRVELTGSLPDGVTAKDATLALVGVIGVDGATYACLEVEGEGLRSLDMDARFTLANMSIEMGAKCALMPVDDVCAAYLSERSLEPIEPVWSDPGCEYQRVVELDLSAVRPLVACPHDLTEIAAVDELDHQRIDFAFVGTCTNGRLSDLERAAAVLAGRRVAPHVRLVVTPGSRTVYSEALRRDVIATLVDAGAIVTPPGCGPCVGTHMGIPGDGDIVITTANRNFRGRMGNRNASIFVGSPETVAASAIAGYITSASEVPAEVTA